MVCVVAPMSGQAQTTGVRSVEVSTYIPSDLVIDGPGYFMLRDPAEPSSRPTLTRSGDFYLSSDGALLSSEGWELLGRKGGSEAGEPTGIGVVWGESTGLVSAWRIDERGRVLVTEDGAERMASSLVLWRPLPEDRLVRVGAARWRIVAADSDDAARIVRPGEGGAGLLKRGWLEQPVPWLRVTEFRREDEEDPRVVPCRIGLPNCLALEGPGFFRVRDPVTGARYLTRCGAFKWDREGRLVTLRRGYRVQAIPREADGPEHDLTLPGAADPGPEPGVASSYIDPQGLFRVQRTDGTAVTEERLVVVPGVPKADRVSVGEGFWSVSPRVEALMSRSGSLPSGGDLPSTRVRAGYLDPRYLDAPLARALETVLRFTQKAMGITRSMSDLAISGRGFFVLRDPSSTSGGYFLTRWGRFHWDSEGFLVNEDGYRVQALDLYGDGTPVDVHVASEIGRSVQASRVTIDGDGNVNEPTADGWVWLRQKIVLAEVVDPTELEEVRPRIYRWPGIETLTALIAEGWGNDRVFAHIESGAIELLESESYGLEKTPPPMGHQIVLEGIYPYVGRIQRSRDLLHWEDWLRYDGRRSGIFEPMTGGWSDAGAVLVGGHVYDVDPGTGVSRFYRVVVDDTTVEPALGGQTLPGAD
ncbi:MAG: hypothetical protein JNL97_01220 [Verrucomicrobiales bacterium]|nr:hypothetical protein [Verrucomicrobiales bacterium]